MALFYKSNSCLLAFDDSPAFSTGQLGLTGQKYGLYFAKLLQDFEFSISPAKTQSKQIGSYDFGVDSVNFSPDVICNLSYITRDDFEVEKLLGLNFNIDGEYQPVFSGIDGHSFNAYLFFTDQEGVDLPTYISGANSFSGVNVISIGNCYLGNGAINMQAGSTPRSTMSFVASNCEMQTLVENYMQIPAINLESGTTGGAADIYLNPAQTHRFLEGGVSGTLLETWKATFQPQFEDVQIANQKLVNANIQSIGLSFTVDRENVYSFGSDHVYSRDIKYPIVGSLSINGVASEYQTGSFANLMQNEETYDITIYNADPQELYLSGLPISELSGVYKLDHLTADQWFRIPNAKLRDSTNRVGVGGFIEFANTFDFSSSPVGGFDYKRGDEKSIDSVFLYSAEGHRMVAADNRIIYDPFIYANDGINIVTILSSDRKIMLCTNHDHEASYQYIPPDDDYTPSALSLTKHSIEQLDSLLSGAGSFASSAPLYSVRDLVSGSGFVRNTGFWASGVDITCISPWNSSGYDAYAGTVITPRHLIFATHFTAPVGAQVNFFSTGNELVSRTITRLSSIPYTSNYYPDITVATLDSDLPSSISPCKFLPSNYVNYLPPTLNRIPALCLDKEEKGLVTDLAYITYGSFNKNAIFLTPEDALRLSFHEAKIGGDSSNPAFILVNNELVLITVWTFGGAGQGTFVSEFLSEIESRIATDGSYSLSYADLSSFTEI